MDVQHGHALLANACASILRPARNASRRDEGDTARPSALNAPGHWDVFISHTQRSTEAKLLALDLHTTLAAKGKRASTKLKKARQW